MAMLVESHLRSYELTHKISDLDAARSVNDNLLSEGAGSWAYELAAADGGLIALKSFRRTESKNDLVEASKVLRLAIKHAPEDRVLLRWRNIHNLAQVLILQSLVFNDPDAATESLVYTEQAVTEIRRAGLNGAEAAEINAMLWQDTQKAYVRRYQLTNSDSDRAKLVEAARTVVEIADISPSMWRQARALLGSILLDQYATGSRDDYLDEANEALQDAYMGGEPIGATPNDLQNLDHIALTLGAARVQRYLSQGNASDRIEALELARRPAGERSSVSRTSVGWVGAVLIAAQLAEEIDDVLEFAKYALNQCQSADGIVGAWFDIILADSYAARYFTIGAVEDAESACCSYKAAINRCGGSTLVIYGASLQLGRIYLRENRPHDAAAVLEVARRAWQLLYSGQVLRGSKERVLEQRVDFPSVATEAYTRCDDPLSAAVALEESRGVLAFEAITGHDIARQLADVGCPELGKRYSAAIRAVSAAESAIGLTGEGRTVALTPWDLQEPEKLIASATRARETLESVLRAVYETPVGERVRSVLADDKDGVKNAILRAAHRHPVIYLSAAETRGVAIVVSGASANTIVLPDLTREVGRKMSEDLWTAYAERKKSRLRWGEMLTDVLGHMGRIAMIEIMRCAALPEGEVVYLIATGTISTLPWHAALIDEASRSCVLDRFAVSYIASARSLPPSEEEHECTSALLVDGGASVDAGLEWEAIGSCFSRRTRISDVDANHKSVLEAMRGNDILHFACHGMGSPTYPLMSSLQVSDGEITLADVLKVGNLDSRLAVLGSCESGVVGSKIPDEMIGFPSALLEAGIKGSVSTLWSVDDRTTSLILNRFYRNWRIGGLEPSVALRDSIIWFRDSSNREKFEALSSFAPAHLAVHTPERDFWADAVAYRDPIYWAGIGFFGV